MCKKIKSWFKWKFNWLGVLNSPLIGLKCEVYFGPIVRGTPYFLPRKRSKDGGMKPIKWFSMYIVPLGWKTKWDEYRFEWNPAVGMVLLTRQFHIEIMPKIKVTDRITAVDSYWEAWLTYKYTDKKLSKKERMLKMFEEYSCTWIDGKNNETDYYLYILKKKHLNTYLNEKIK